MTRSGLSPRPLAATKPVLGVHGDCVPAGAAVDAVALAVLDVDAVHAGSTLEDVVAWAAVELVVPALPRSRSAPRLP